MLTILQPLPEGASVDYPLSEKMRLTLTPMSRAAVWLCRGGGAGAGVGVGVPRTGVYVAYTHPQPVRRSRFADRKPACVQVRLTIVFRNNQSVARSSRSG